MTYDEWKGTPPEDPYEDKYDDNEEEETMTRIEELAKSRDHLQTAARSIDNAMKAAVLSRARRRDLESLEQRVYDAIIDLNDELEVRAG